MSDRLRMAGYTGSTDQEAIESLVTETFGMSTVSYLMSCGPSLLPSLEELQEEFDCSGAYEVTEDVLTKQVDTGRIVVTEEERYIRNDSMLILSEKIGVDSFGLFASFYPVIYIMQQSSDEPSSSQKTTD